MAVTAKVVLNSIVDGTDQTQLFFNADYNDGTQGASYTLTFSPEEDDSE